MLPQTHVIAQLAIAKIVQRKIANAPNATATRQLRAVANRVIAKTARKKTANAPNATAAKQLQASQHQSIVFC